jgi:hypothetical protein
MNDHLLHEAALVRLFNSFPAMKRQIDDELLEAYRDVAIKFRIRALHAAVERLVLGMVANQDLQFGPSTAQLAAECRLQEKVLDHFERRAGPRQISPPQEFSEEHREKMARKMLSLALKVVVHVPEYA